MQLGKLRHKIVIQQPTETRNISGYPSVAWSTYKTVWASIMPMQGRETTIADQTGGDITHEVHLHYESGYTPKMRVKWGSRYFEIRSVINLEERDREVVLKCHERIG